MTKIQLYVQQNGTDGVQSRIADVIRHTGLNSHGKADAPLPWIKGSEELAQKDMTHDP